MHSDAEATEPGDAISGCGPHGHPRNGWVSVLWSTETQPCGSTPWPEQHRATLFR